VRSILRRKKTALLFAANSARSSSDAVVMRSCVAIKSPVFLRWPLERAVFQVYRFSLEPSLKLGAAWSC